MFSQLHRTLETLGQPTVRLDLPGGGRLLVLVFGGRVLALCPPGAEESFFWHHPALLDPAAAQAWAAAPGWRNPGGDRTWMAPELELFIADRERPGASYAVPAALDPGAWQVQAHSAVQCALHTAAHLRLLHAGRSVRAVLTKTLAATANPLAGLPLAAALGYAGYGLQTTLSVEPEPLAVPAVAVGLWQLLQLPQPGQMRLTSWRAAAPVVVFGPLAPAEVTAAPRLLAWSMTPGAETTKIAVKADVCAGRAGYVWGEGDVWNLVVRQFSVWPGGDYVDCLWHPPYETGFAFQACAVRGGSESFNEMEYHAPAVRTRSGAGQALDESRLWAFRGARTDIEAAAVALLGEVDGAPG